MSKMITLKNSREFGSVYSTKNSVANKYLVMYLRSNGLDYNRLGISVSKKVGNSVVRHHITRLLRESVRKNDALVKEGNRIIIVARKDVKNKNFKEVDGAVFHLLKIHGILKWSDCVKKILLAVIHIYQKYISPLKRTPSCIYTPCCSEYAAQAIKKYGAGKGGFLAIKRILRCHPFHKGGYYPVP